MLETRVTMRMAIGALKFANVVRMDRVNQMVCFMCLSHIVMPNVARQRRVVRKAASLSLLMYASARLLTALT
eukprot:5261989-Amphidinium_carterae.1